MASNITYDPEKFQLTLVRYKASGERFELAVDPDEAIAYRNGKQKDVNLVLKAKHIYADVQKGMLATVSKYESVFGSLDEDAIIRKILVEGELHLTADYKKKLRDEKKAQILDIIHVHCVDPVSHTPVPIVRIEKALVAAKVRIDEFKPAKEQVSAILHAISSVLPLHVEQKVISFVVASSYASKVKQVVGVLSSQSWTADGSLFGSVVVPAGLADDVIKKIQSVSHGVARVTVETKEGKIE